MSFRLSFRKPNIVYKTGDEILEEHPGLKWSKYIPILDIPINYLEIGCHKGKHVVEMARSYCIHKDSKIYCIDPWEDYDKYPEYKNQQETIFQTFTKSIEPFKDKCIVIKGYSEIEVPKFGNNFFDIVFVDGNHETEYVYKDAVLALEKTKIGGYIIFDDYMTQWWESVIKGVDMFVENYKNRIEVIAKPTDCYATLKHCSQAIVRRLS